VPVSKTGISGAGALVKGLRLSLLGMVPGEVRWLRIPPQLAYGAAPHGDVPPDTSVFYQVTLLSTFPTHKAGFDLAAQAKSCKRGERWRYQLGGCRLCPAGTFNQYPAQTGCYACAPGKTSSTGAVRCFNGVPGNYTQTVNGAEKVVEMKAAPPTDASGEYVMPSE
jgi:hypothetical protein